MSARRGRWLPYALPAACAVAALLAFSWAGGAEGGRISDGDGVDGIAAGGLETATDRLLRGGEPSPSSRERFLDDLSTAVAAGRGREEGGAVVAWSERSDVPELAATVLSAYRDGGTASLATSGYLDLKGNAWGAVARDSRGWVDIVLVSTADGETSEARVARLSASGARGTGEGE